jgi:probable F420-dependent oxidoreductase
MKLGFALPQIGAQASSERLIKVATKAEELGYDSLWVLERLLWPIAPRVPYPPTPDGKLPELYQHVLDPIETLTFIAGRTETIGLGTSVIVLPYHNPVMLARRLATLDQLSGGRAVCGFGLGWSPDEFEASGVPFERRGARTDEFLRLLVQIWASDVVEFKGEFYTVPASKIGPKPVPRATQPYPPIYLAGTAPQTFERIAQFAHGWNPVGPPPFEELAFSIRTMRDVAAHHGRPPEEMEVVLRVFPSITDEPLGSQRAVFSGSIDELAADVSQFEEIGVTELIIDLNFFPRYEDLSALIERMEQLKGLI